MWTLMKSRPVRTGPEPGPAGDGLGFSRTVDVLWTCEEFQFFESCSEASLWTWVFSGLQGLTLQVC